MTILSKGKRARKRYHNGTNRKNTNLQRGIEKRVRA